MSLSQKHSGKVLVPWFNISEWKLVYNLIYSETNQNWPHALQILKIWKLRTPLLSAGVEGTLIAIEALLASPTRLSSSELSQIFSTALVRFLNLCAANSDRQGSFYKVAMKNELPKWLISLRHEIAHSHKIPSFSMLDLSLRFCLNWLKDKYWDFQLNEMTDFSIQLFDNKLLEDSLNIYILKKQLKDDFSKKDLTKLITKFEQRINKRILDKTDLFNSLTEVLTQELRNNTEQSIEKVCEILIEKLSFFFTEENDGRNSEIEEIPDSILIKWNFLLNIFYKTEIMPHFIKKLLDFINDYKICFFHKKMAGLWIKEIFKATKKESSSLTFENENSSLKNSKLFDEILHQINPYTGIYINEVLTYNSVPDDFIKSVILLINAYNTIELHSIDRIYTTVDLNIGFEATLSETRICEKTSRWCLVEDASLFNDLPLGVLPHQSRDENPVLILQ